MKTENIRKFLSTNYSDEKLAALLAHCESGRLAWMSCCCFIGIPTADHPLCGKLPILVPGSVPHYKLAKLLPYAEAADNEFMFLGMALGDAERRERLLPLIREEMERREAAKNVEEMEEVTA